MKEPGKLKFMESQKVGHDCRTEQVHKQFLQYEEFKLKSSKYKCNILFLGVFGI